LAAVAKKVAQLHFVGEIGIRSWRRGEKERGWRREEKAGRL
jgi:hypothetical protein